METKENGMKLWEVMRFLEENPTDVYEAQLNDWGGKARITVKAGYSKYYYKFEIFDGERRLVDQSQPFELDLDWQLVRQPVSGNEKGDKGDKGDWKKIFGWNVRYLRKERSLTQKNLGVLLGVHGSTISNWETHKIIPYSSTLSNIANLFEVTVDELIFKDIALFRLGGGTERKERVIK